ncbi:MAG: hypothetical protein ACREFE_19545 [Limisphaerales bacterium]
MKRRLRMLRRRSAMFTGTDSKVEKFIDLMNSFGVQEIARAGKAALRRK